MTDLELARRLIELKAHLDLLNELPLVGMMEALVTRSTGASYSELQQEQRVATETVALTVAFLNEVASVGRRDSAAE